MPVSESLYVPVLPVPPDREQDETAHDACVLLPERFCVLVPEGAHDVSPLASPRADSKMLKESWCGKRKLGAWKVRLEVALSCRVQRRQRTEDRQAGEKQVRLEAAPSCQVPIHVTCHVTS